jgi:hypothetical protein
MGRYSRLTSWRTETQPFLTTCDASACIYLHRRGRGAARLCPTWREQSLLLLLLLRLTSREVRQHPPSSAPTLGSPAPAPDICACCPNCLTWFVLFRGCFCSCKSLVSVACLREQVRSEASSVAHRSERQANSGPRRSLRGCERPQ